MHSTILWHLKREVNLCYLAKRALDFERTSAHACCVVGNCFSLQKEHDTALKFFQRAIQLQPDFAYAYTLSGAWSGAGPVPRAVLLLHLLLKQSAAARSRVLTAPRPRGSARPRVQRQRRLREGDGVLPLGDPHR